ncbi:MAG TPA: 2-isopropylmalate synthase [Symbiobacteriaceae bacterium]|nr:2-isopropylmalate synthase [Symbiobacteriaceae bacterium]
MGRIQLLDTTLRDGEQTPGVRFAPHEKVEIARQLARVGVDVIQAGFPITSSGEFEAIRAIVRSVHGPVISAFARTTKEDIDLAYEAIREADDPRIDLVLATSPIHMQYKLRKTPEQVLNAAVEAVTYVKKLGCICQFYAEDATRSDWNFLVKVFSAVAAAGCDVLCAPDTVGYTVPREHYKLFRYLHDNVDRPATAILAAHCHNDLGMATANTLAAIEGGALQVECTVNGIGERAGNASLEEVVMALQTRQDYADYQGHFFGTTSTELFRTSLMVSHLSGVVVQPNKAVVGANAFAHESGMHQDGILKERSTYEIMRPEDVGVARSQFVLGKHSGRHAIKHRLQELGVEVEEIILMRVFHRFKELCDREKRVTDRDLMMLVEEEQRAMQTIREAAAGDQGAPKQ